MGISIQVPSSELVTENGQTFVRYVIVVSTHLSVWEVILIFVYSLIDDK